MPASHQMRPCSAPRAPQYVPVENFDTSGYFWAHSGTCALRQEPTSLGSADPQLPGHVSPRLWVPSTSENATTEEPAAEARRSRASSRVQIQTACMRRTSSAARPSRRVGPRPAARPDTPSLQGRRHLTVTDASAAAVTQQ
jgi:hypothetical protein